MIMLPLTVYDVGNFWLKDKWQLLDELKCKLEDVLQLKRLSICHVVTVVRQEVS